MKKPKPSLRDDDSQNTLLGDLESIRSLLDLSPTAAVAEDESSDVPMLEDMIDGAFTVNESIMASRESLLTSHESLLTSRESLPASRASIDDGAGGKSGLADDTITALLGDEWRSAAQQILADARSAVEGGGRWSAQQTRALNDSLKVRIDHTVDDWLTQLMHERIEDLRSRLLGVLEREIDEFTRRLTDTDDADDDGE